VNRAEEWEWSSFRTIAGLAPRPRPHLGCEPFVQLLGLRETTERLAAMRAYVRDAPPVLSGFRDERRPYVGLSWPAGPARNAARPRPAGAMIGL
jgi:hypothetical protein